MAVRRLLCFVSLALLISSCSDPSTAPVAPSPALTVPTPDAGVPTCASDTATPEMSCGSLAWATSDTKSRPRNHHLTVVAETAKGTFLYAIAGVNDNRPIANVDFAALDDAGKLGAFTALENFPKSVGGLVGGVVGNVIVAAGGTTSGVVTDQSYAAVIGEDGSLSKWKSTGSVLHPRMHPGAIVSGSNIYVMGGFDDPDVWDDVVRATVEPDGTMSSWASAGKLPGPRSHFSVTLVDGYVFLAGGLDKSAYQGPSGLTEVSRGHILEDGTLGEWSSMSKLPVALATHASFSYGGYLYVGGGMNDKGGEEKRMWRAPIGEGHELGKWETVAPLPLARAHVHQFPVARNHVYAVAGALDMDLRSTDQIEVGSFE